MTQQMMWMHSVRGTPARHENPVAEPVSFLSAMPLRSASPTGRRWPTSAASIYELFCRWLSLDTVTMSFNPKPWWCSLLLIFEHPFLAQVHTEELEQQHQNFCTP